jgi:GMP synthase PP-ATPase subunit
VLQIHSAPIAERADRPQRLKPMANWFRPLIHLDMATKEMLIAALSELDRVTYDITSKPPGTIEWE